MSAKWVINPHDLIAFLESQGFDVERSEISLADGGGSLTARKESGTRAILVRTDAGGHLQILLTDALDDLAADPIDIAGLRLTVTDTTIRRRTVRGAVTNLEQFESAVRFLSSGTGRN
jgi:hypothetical protein